MTDHYVTITGVFKDNNSGQIWLRVQSWGEQYYLNFSEFYNYNIGVPFGNLIFVE